MKDNPFPLLSTAPVSCNSWICAGEGRTVETYSEEKAREAHKAGYKVVTAYAHLVSLNT